MATVADAGEMGFWGVCFKESLIALTLSRTWRWTSTALPGVPQVASLFHTGKPLP